MLSGTGKQKPKLHSVKYVYEFASHDNEYETIQNFIRDSAFQSEGPGVPTQIIFKSSGASVEPSFRQEQGSLGSSPSTLHGVSSAITTTENDTFKEKRNSEVEKFDAKAIDAFTTLTSVEPILQTGLAYTGRDPSSVEDIICSAWAIVLSYQTDNQHVHFELCQNDSSRGFHLGFEVTPATSLGSLVEDAAKRRMDAGQLKQLQVLPYDEAAQHFRTGIKLLRDCNEPTVQRGVNDTFGQGLAVLVDCMVMEDISLAVSFNKRLTSTQRMRLLMDDFEHVVWQMLRCDLYTKQVADLALLGPVSQRQLRSLNRPLYPNKNECVHHLFTKTATKYADRTAVHAWDGDLSYGELFEQSTVLAALLQKMGVRNETYVPVLFEKSARSITALVAVILAGGAVVPLDPSLPPLRLQSIVQDVEASIIVCSEKHEAKIPECILESKRVILGEKHLVVSRHSPTHEINSPQASLTTTDNALYVVFTSGSTGTPKGVVVTHSQFCSSCDGFKDAIYLAAPGRRVLHYSSFAFDIAMLEVFWTLCVGSCICIPSDETRLNDLAKCIVDLDIDWAMLTPSVASLISPESVPSLDILCLIGEALPQKIADEWADHVTTINGYGPAECSILTVISEPRVRGVKSISLGRPRNCTIWIVDQDVDRVMPFGAIGEIVVEGPVVARGYLGREDLTNAVFLHEPSFLKEFAMSTSRFYRTGDLGRMSPDGEIDFCGRKDSQVKINGQRVELGDIEHHVASSLNSAASLTGEWPKSNQFHTVVELVEQEVDRSVVVAFITKISQSRDYTNTRGMIASDRSSQSGADILSLFDAITSNLEGSLPAYMRPKFCIPCRSLPLTPSGKVDRKELRAIGKSKLQEILRGLRNRDTHENPKQIDNEAQSMRLALDAAVYPDLGAYPRKATPRSEVSYSTSGDDFNLTPVEVALRTAWAKVLNIAEDDISPDDDFFRIGGDSIGAIKVVAACRKASLQISVESIFRNSILREMALVCRLKRLASEPEPSASQLSAFGLLAKKDTQDLLEEAAFQCDVSSQMIEDVYPCTYMQEGLMAVNLTRPGAYTGRWIHRLPADIDVPKFKRIWEDIHAKSPILRTRFVTSMAAGSLQAVIKEQINWIAHDDVEAYIAADEAKPMLPGSSLNRFALVKSTNGSITYFVWTIHHMLYDGWSISLLCKRVNETYRNCPPADSEDFRTFIAYTQKLNQKEAAKYWREELRDVAASTFPCPPQPGHQPYARAVLRDELDLPLTNRTDWTMSTIIRAAWAIMISHYSRTDDVLFGATVSGRNAPLENIENIEAPVIATVPVRLHISHSTKLTEFLRRVQAHASAMIPFEQTGIQMIRSLDSDTRRGCDFQNLLVIQMGGGWDNDEPLGRPIYREEFTTFPVTCEVWVQPQSIQFAIHVDEAVTSRVFVAEAIECVKVVVKQLLQVSPDSLTEIKNLHFEESVNNTLTQTAAASEDPNTTVSSIHEHISWCATKHENDEAICSSEESITNKDLDMLSSSLASYLRSLGVGSGSFIPLCFEKSVWAVVSMLAVLKAGAAFIPLEPSQPLSRLRGIVKDANPRIILMSPFQAKATDLGALAYIVVDQNSIRGLPTAIVSQWRLQVMLNDPAYVIYTSGSTGEPKGVVISHSSFVSSALAHGRLLGMERRPRVLQFSSYSFDASLLEIMTTLIHGGTVCVASEKERVGELPVFMNRMKVNWALLTPSVARLLQPTDIPGLEVLVLGGEIPDEALIARWMESGLHVFNAYGPSECSVVASARSYRQGEQVNCIDSRNIGYPVGCNAWVVNPTDIDELLPDGEIGELLIEGPIVASGYLHDAGKSEAKFVVKPGWVPTQLSDITHHRVYKTGDLVRRATDKTLVYIGRKDLQIKIHGQRVEIEEIEAQLIKCVGVEQCVVLFPSVGMFKEQLTAVVHLTGEIAKTTKFTESLGMSSDKADIIRSNLSRKVPSVMIPVHWIDLRTLATTISKFPLTAAGKIDRQKILKLIEEVTCSSTDTDLPSGETSLIAENIVTLDSGGEKTVSQLVLKVSSMMKSKGFIHSSPDLAQMSLHICGLDSLDMMSLMHFILLKYKVRIPMQLLMATGTTFRTLANFIEHGEVVSTVNALPSLSMDLMSEINRHDEKIARIQQETQDSLLEGKQNSTIIWQRDITITVLLTGASGFLGTQLLRQLLERHNVQRVVVIGRGLTTELAKTRVVEAARKALWWTEYHEEKLEVWRGDLSQPKFGLNTSQWNIVCDGKTFNSIVHSGAQVHWNKSFSDLEAVNVLSTVAFLEIVVAHPRQRFIYISGGRQWITNDEKEKDVSCELAESLGYSQTKFVSEALVKRAAYRCKIRKNNMAVVRPGLIIGTPTEGVANSDDYIWRMAAACIDTGVYNADDMDAWIHISDANTTSSVILAAAFAPELSPLYSVEDGMTWGSFWFIIETLGYGLKSVPASEWLSMIRSELDSRQEEHPLWPLAHLLGSETMKWDLHSYDENKQVTSLHLRISVKKNLEFLASVGFIPRPPGSVPVDTQLMRAFSR